MAEPSDNASPVFEQTKPDLVLTPSRADEDFISFSREYSAWAVVQQNLHLRLLANKWKKTGERSKYARTESLRQTKDATRCFRSPYLLILSTAPHPHTRIRQLNMRVIPEMLTLSCSIVVVILATPLFSVTTLSSACRTTAVLKPPSAYATI
jgi:hypothetical protein